MKFVSYHEIIAVLQRNGAIEICEKDELRILERPMHGLQVFLRSHPDDAIEYPRNRRVCSEENFAAAFEVLRPATSSSVFDRQNNPLSR